MAWATVKATGSGALAWRLMIPGHPYEAVSSSALIGAGTHGRLRLGGLDSSPIMWGETLDPAMCDLTANGFTASIVEDGAHRWNDSFSLQPETVYYLAAEMTVGTTTMDLAASGPANGTVLYVGQECVLITAGGSTASLTVTRAYRNTVATAHYVDASLGLTLPEVTTSRPSVKGMLAFLYAYGDGETGDGTLVWRGIVGAEPKLRGLTTWEIAIGSVAGILDQKLSADLQEPVALRGISYVSSTVPKFTISMKTGTSPYGVEVDRATITGTATFYETQADFCAAINVLIRTATAAWTTKLNLASGALPTLIATPNAFGSWSLVYSTDGTGQWLSVSSSAERGSNPIDPRFRSTDRMVLTLDGTSRTGSAATSVYEVPYADEPVIEGAGTVPRGLIGRYADIAATSVYLGGIATIVSGDAATIAWPEFNGHAERAISYPSTAWDATNRFATVSVVPTRDTGRNERFYTAASVPSVTVSRTYSASGTFADFIAALTTGAPTQSGLGRQPNITVEHVDTTTTSTNVAAATAGRAWLTQRGYVGTSDVVLAEMLTEESKAAGMVPSIGTDGRLLWVEFRVGAATEDTTYDVTADTNLSGRQLPGYEPSAFGLVNTITLRTGFDPVSGDHNGDLFNLKDARALARQPVPFPMEIEPRSTYVSGDRMIPVGDVIAMAQAWFGVLGAAYAVITVTCPLSAIDAIIGTQVSLTISQIPDTESGGRGITSLPGVVIGRAVKPMAGAVELTVLTTQVRVAGYAPSSLIQTVTGAGATRVITLDAVQTSGYVTASGWTVGDAVTLLQYDTAAPSQITATITVVSTATREITIGTISGATPGGTLTLEFSAASVATTAQQAWCYIAGTDLFIGFATQKNARQFAA